MDAAAAALVAVDAFQIGQQGAEQLHCSGELRHSASPVLQPVSERMLRAAGPGRFLQQVFQPEPLPFGQALHLQDTAIRRGDGVFPRQADRAHLQLTLCRHCEPGPLADLLPDPDLPCGPPIKQLFHRFDGVRTFTAVLRQGCGVLRQDGCPRPDIAPAGEILLEDDRVHLALLLRLIDQRRAAGMHKADDLKRSGPCFQHRSVRQRHAVLQWSIYHEQTSSIGYSGSIIAYFPECSKMEAPSVPLSGPEILFLWIPGTLSAILQGRKPHFRRLFSGHEKGELYERKYRSKKG